MDPLQELRDSFPVEDQQRIEKTKDRYRLRASQTIGQEMGLVLSQDKERTRPRANFDATAASAGQREVEAGVGRPGPQFWIPARLLHGRRQRDGVRFVSWQINAGECARLRKVQGRVARLSQPK